MTPIRSAGASVAADAIVIGAGIVGAACADELARCGLKVLIVEAGEIGGGATAAGMGHIVVMDDSEAEFALTHYSARLWEELADELPSGAEYTAAGTLWVAADDEEMAEVRRKHSFYAQRGVRTEILDAQDLEQAEPNLRKGLAGALFVPADAIVYPPRVAAFLVECACRNGARLERGRRIHNMAELANATALIVNATGASAPALSPGLDIQPRKGHLLITDRYPGFVRHQLVELGYLKSAHSIDEDSVAFNVQPRQTGQVLIGSSRQYGSSDPAIEHRMMKRMLERAALYMPSIGRLSAIRGWTGFRASTPGKLPYIGRSPRQPNVWIASGHEGLGITTSLATAKLLADQILNRQPAIPLEPYAPNG